MKKSAIKHAAAGILFTLASHKAYSKPPDMAQVLKIGGMFAGSSLFTHEALNTKELKRSPDLNRHVAYAMTTSGFMGLGGMYLASGIRAYLPLGLVYTGMGLLGQYLSYKTHRNVDPDTNP